jgi:hypothetical protein
LQEPQHNLSDSDLIAFFDGSMRERSAGAFAEDDLGAGSGRELAMPADEVRVKVSLDYAPNLEAFGVGLLDVLIDVALWIDDDGVGLGPNEIRCVRKTPQIELLEVHSARLLPLSEYHSAGLSLNANGRLRRNRASFEHTRLLATGILLLRDGGPL